MLVWKKTFFHPLEPNVVDEFFVSMQSRTKMHFNLMPNFIPIWKFSAALTFDVTRSAANQGDCTNTWTWLTMQTSAYHVEKSISDGSTQRRAEEKLAFLSSTQNRTADKRERSSRFLFLFTTARGPGLFEVGWISKGNFALKQIILELF